MFAILVNELAAMVASADDGDSPVFLLVLGPAGGIGAYFLLWRYYRNTHTSHAFEHETRIAAQSITGDDDKIDEVKGTKRSEINGDNRTDHRKRVQRAG